VIDEVGSSRAPGAPVHPVGVVVCPWVKRGVVRSLVVEGGRTDLKVSAGKTGDAPHGPPWRLRCTVRCLRTGELRSGRVRSAAGMRNLPTRRPVRWAPSQKGIRPAEPIQQSGVPRGVMLR
jgi:hypothetical protein